MINSIEVLTNVLLNLFKEKNIRLQKIDSLEMPLNYYISEIMLNKILEIIFEFCSTNQYCMSINRNKYSQVKVILFDKSTIERLTFVFVTCMPTNINKFLEDIYNKKINFLKKINIIPVIGPDGVGKSTILNEVINTLEERVFFKRFKKVVRNSVLYNIFHPLNKNSVRKKVGKKSVKNQHDDIHYLLCILSALSAYPYLLFQILVKKRIVFLDRFFYDYLLKNISFLNKETYLRENWRLLLKIIPRSYFLIHLDADAKIILSRKEELSKDDIDKYRKLNFKLYLEKPSIVYLYINTGLKIERCKEVLLSALSDNSLIKKKSYI